MLQVDDASLCRWLRKALFQRDRGNGSPSLWQPKSEDTPVTGDVKTACGNKNCSEMTQTRHAIARRSSCENLLTGIAAEPVQTVIALGAYHPNNRFGAAVSCCHDRGTTTV